MNGTTHNDIAVFSLEPNNLEMVIRGTDGVMYHNWSDDAGATWSGWQSLGINILGTPTVITTGPDRQDLFVRGTDNVIYHQTWTRTGGRTNWRSLNGTTNDDIAVISHEPGHLEAFVRGVDGNLYHSWSIDAGVTWSSWYNMGHKLLGKPAVVSWGPGRSDVFVRGEDDVMYHLAYNSSVGWDTWKSLGGQTKFAPQAHTWGEGRLDVFHLGLDGNFYQMWWEGAYQSGWQQVGSSASATSTVSVTPSSAPRGTMFHQPGTGFTPNAQVRLHFTYPDGSLHSHTVTTSTNGSYTNDYTMPSDALIGQYYYHALDLTSNTWSNTVSFIVEADPLTYRVSGTVTDANGNGLGGVTISDGTRLAHTTSSGDYTISGVPAGSYTLTPSKDGFSFSPTSLSVTVNGDLTGQNFTATPLTFTISGRVTDANGNGLGGVTISDGTRIANTTSSGDYTISDVPAGSYTLTPSKDGFSFSPTSLSVTVNGDLTGQNFTGTL
ncbi:carboxypeptidase regulatory-like domain-containing protein, partial [Candidatus Chloroploca sp. Khr17]|uniref:carboxypeptidase regulatory-like domain-containing protein n=1 Tax=Candidatus Chloroploca sp. Khr17 TaxID=2496869 RepID=UPI0013EC886A